MKKNILSSLLILASLCCSSQTARYIHPSTVEVLFSISDFKNTSPFSGLSKGYRGLGFSFTKGVTTHFDWNATANFLYADSLMKSEQKFASKQLFATVDLSVRWRLLQPAFLLQPFVSSGIGLSGANNYFGPYIPVGAGLQVNVSPEIFATLRCQRRIGLNNNIAGHYFYSIGLAGNIGRRQVKKTASSPVPAIPQPVIADRDKDGNQTALTCVLMYQESKNITVAPTQTVMVFLITLTNAQTFLVL